MVIIYTHSTLKLFIHVYLSWLEKYFYYWGLKTVKYSLNHQTRYFVISAFHHSHTQRDWWSGHLTTLRRKEQSISSRWRANNIFSIPSHQLSICTSQSQNTFWFNSTMSVECTNPIPILVLAVLTGPFGLI